ncbi:hypothetical protein DL95DRAFT_511257 [Leptodontidium sp. 2 PMI_412]|nr:hypothetical protein DL95DRAFT_511257 [Leptodontidium sp. 2 PMI_412]
MTSPSDTVAAVADSNSSPMSISLDTLIAQAASDLAGQIIDSNATVPPAQAMHMFSFICSPDFTIALVVASAVASADPATLREFDLCQVPDAPKPATFTLFPKLPYEIRCMVWKAALPNAKTVKRMPLMTYRTQGGGNAQQLRELADRVNEDCVIPIALYINQESRNETLRRYYVVPATLPDPTIKIAPYVFSRGLDAALIDFSSAINNQTVLNWKDNTWLSGLSTKDMESCASQIKLLWIDLDGSYQVANGGFAPFSRHSSHEHPNGTMEDPWCCCFHFFPALENIIFSINHARDTELVDIYARAEFFDSFQKILESHVTSFNSGEAPKISLSNRLLDGSLDNEGGFRVAEFVDDYGGHEHWEADSDEDNDWEEDGGNHAFIFGGRDSEDEDESSDDEDSDEE